MSRPPPSYDDAAKAAQNQPVSARGVGVESVSSNTQLVYPQQQNTPEAAGYPPFGNSFQPGGQRVHPNSMPYGFIPANQNQSAYPPPNPAYYGPSQSQNVIIAPVTNVSVHRFGFNSVQTVCNHCHQPIVTMTRYKPGSYAWIMCVMIVLAGLGFPIILLGLCFIPFCVKSCMDVVHSCPSCKQHIATCARSRSRSLF